MDDYQEGLSVGIRIAEGKAKLYTEAIARIETQGLRLPLYRAMLVRELEVEILVAKQLAAMHTKAVAQTN